MNHDISHAANQTLIRNFT